MKHLALIPLFLLCMACQHPSTPSDLHLLVGTYTDGGESQGIYSGLFNEQSGQATLRSSLMVENPSFVRFLPGSSAFCTLSEFHDARAAAHLGSYAPEDGRLRLVSSCLAAPEGPGAEDPCNAWSDGSHIVTANYSGGSLSVFAIGADSTLSLRQFISYPALRDSTVSHIHCALPTPDSRYLLVTDLGNDCIYRYTIHPGAAPDGEADFLTDHCIAYTGPNGWGPRHFVFSNDGSFMYLINELGGTIVVFRYNDGVLEPIQNEMAEEVPAHGSADIHLSPDGRFLYASHRLQHDGISIWQVDSLSGRISKVGYQPTGRHPRNFILTPSGNYLLVACRDDDRIEVYRRHTDTGLLSPTDHDIKLPRPVCLQWLGE